MSSTTDYAGLRDQILMNHRYVVNKSQHASLTRTTEIIIKATMIDPLQFTAKIIGFTFTPGDTKTCLVGKGGPSPHAALENLLLDTTFAITVAEMEGGLQDLEGDSDIGYALLSGGTLYLSQ